MASTVPRRASGIVCPQPHLQGAPTCPARPGGLSREADVRAACPAYGGTMSCSSRSPGRPSPISSPRLRRIRAHHRFEVDRVAACGYGLATLPLVLSHASLLTVPVLTVLVAPMAFRRSRPLLSLTVLIIGLAAVGAWRPELLP